MNVLVTGSKGFIGQNFIKRLEKENNINIVEFDRSSRWEFLESVIETIDFIFHFAGEVHPKSSDDDFQKSNVSLTRKIMALIEFKNKKIPFFMVSSIHAGLQKNTYGKTKRQAEVYLEEYAQRNDAVAWICRLPHVFGEGCKPNYNSVISTWMYNAIHGKEIVVFDRSISMTYVYVQDIVEDFMECLKLVGEQGVATYIDTKITYTTTLGEVEDYILEFSRADDEYEVKAPLFKKKLFFTYTDYVKNSK